MKPLYGDWNTTLPKDCLQTGEKIDRETMFHFRENAGNQNDSMIQMSEVADIVGGLPIYDTIRREHPYAPWIYAGQCYAGQRTNKNPALMPMIYICSRYRADTREQLQMNIEMAKHTCQMIAAAGAIPIAPHLYFPRFMDDNLPDERYFGMGAGKRLMDLCVTFHVVTVDGVISEGMQEEIKYMTETLLLEGSVENYTRQEAEKIVMDRMER